MASAGVIAAVSLGATAVGTGMSLYQQKQAADKQEEANKVSSAQAQVENARNRRKAIAQARMAQARNIAMQSADVANSSSLTGAQSSISSTLGSNIGMQNARIGSQQRIQGLQQQAADRMAIGGMWQAAGNIAGQAGMAYNAYGPSSTPSSGMTPSGAGFTS